MIKTESQYCLEQKLAQAIINPNRISVVRSAVFTNSSNVPCFHGYGMVHSRAIDGEGDDASQYIT